MSDAPAGRQVVRLCDERLEEFLADLAQAPDAATVGQRLTDDFARAVAADRALLYVLEEGDGALRLKATTPADGEPRRADAEAHVPDDASHPLVVATLSLGAIAGTADGTSASPLAPGRWVLVPLPQPQLSWSSAPIALDEARQRLREGWEPITMAHGERRRRAGLAPLGVVALLLGSYERDPQIVVDALLTAASLAGPILGRSLAVDQYRDTAARLDRQRDLLHAASAELEERVRAATADLAEQNAQLQWQSEELERANRLKTEFLASMSHELRTPINALIGYTALLRDRVYGDLTPKQEDGLRRIHNSAEQLLTLINDILDLARIEAGRMPVHLERVVLAPLLREAAQLPEHAARTKGLEFTIALPPDSLAVNTDPEKLKQVLGNLLSNAVKFTAQGHVAIRAERVGDRVRIDVEDTGLGIAPRDQALIWEDFRQLDQSRTREYGGTGLGLSIVRKIAERLDATVSLSSEPGAGSTFSVSVPASDG